MKSFAQAYGAVISVFVLLACSVGQDPNLKAATYASQTWLALVDAGHYSESWESASPWFQQKISKEQWGQTMSSFRSPLGQLMSRQLMNASYETNPADAPAGRYYVIQFRTTFADYPPVTETVTMMQEPNGQWRVSGYYFRRAEDELATGAPYG